MVHKSMVAEHSHSVIDSIHAKTNVHSGGARCSFVLTRWPWCTRRFCMFVMNSDHDGAQGDVVSLVVFAEL